MRFSAIVLLAIIGLTAASVLNKKGSHNNNSQDNQNNNNNRNHHNNNNENNNDNYDDNNNNSQNNNNNNNNGYSADKKFLQKQQAVLQLLANIYQNNNQKHYNSNFQPQQNLNKFNNPQAVKNFLKNYYNNNFLPNDEVFSSTSQQHQNQAGQLFNFFYSAQDWNTFYQAAAWARNRFNPDQFVFAFSAAVLNHPSTQGIVLPPLYEIIPQAFVPATALQQVYNAYFEGKQYASVYANYSNQNYRNYKYNSYFNNNNNNNNNDDNNNNNDNNNNQNNNDYNNPHNPNSVFTDDDGSIVNNAGIPENPENRVSYFTEDIGVNEFNARYLAQNPPFYGSNNDYNNDEITDNNSNGNNKNNYYSQRNIRQGQKFYYNVQQLYARYVLERISNDLPIPKPVNFNQGIKYGYNSNLQYPNGQAFPARPPNTKFQQQQQNNNNNNNNAQQPNNNQAQNPQTYQYRLQQAAETGFVINNDGSKTQLNGNQGVGILANLIANPASNPNADYYGDFFSTGSNAIGNIVDPNTQNGVAPGPVANYATAARDPAYYKFLANILQIFYNYQNNLGPYKQYQLAFPGVKIQSFDVSRLTTYFDYYKVNVNNAVNQNPIENNNDNNNNDNNNNNNNNNNSNNNNNGNYYVKYQRLNNKPYNYKLVVQSDKNTKAVVRVFIGPKFDSNGQGFTLPQASQYFVQLDKFTVQLHNGQNVFQRNSQQSPNYNNDQPGFQQLWSHVQQAQNGQQNFYVNPAQNYNYGFPQRAQLPKGFPSGQQFVFYAIVTDANNNNNNNDNVNNENENFQYNNQNNNNNNENYNDNNNNDNDDQNDNNNNNNNNNNSHNNYNFQDGRSIGFPFDRPVKDANYETANQYFKTVTIYHKNQNNFNNDN